MDIWEEIPDEVRRRPLTAKRMLADFDPNEHPRGGNPANPGQFSAEARGDVYGKPMKAGKYQEGDPRNDPEFERHEVRKAKLTNRYVGVTANDLIKAMKKGKTGKEMESMLATYRQANDDRKEGIGGGTDELYDRLHDPATNARTGYNPERRKLHQAIVDSFEEKAKKVPSEGKAIVMAGPSGAGKSTFLENNADKLGVTMETGPDGKKHPSNYIVLNPDDLKDLLPVDLKRYPGLGPNEMASINHEESSTLTKTLIRTLMGQGKNILLDVALPDAEKGVKNYIGPGGDKYKHTAVLVDGDLANSLHNSGLRYKKIDEKTGKRTYKGRYLSTDVVMMQKPKKPGYRSANAEAFEDFIKDPHVQQAMVYDPYNQSAGLRRVTPGDHMNHTSGMMSLGGQVESTEITQKIKDFNSGKISRAQLVQYLAHDAHYADEDPRPYDMHSPENYHWIEGGTPYKPGTWDEVERAHDVKMLPRDIFNEVADIIAKRII